MSSRFALVRRLRALLRDVMANIRHDLMAATATVLTTTVALCLLGAAMLASAQVEAMKDHWYDRVEVSVFLCTDTSIGDNCRGELSDADKRLLYDSVAAMPQVEQVWFETREQAWEEFSSRFAGSAVLEGITQEAMPESLRVKLVNPSQGSVIEQALARTRGVEQVQDQHRILSRFFGILSKVQTAALATAAAALVAAAVLITLGVRVAVGHRRREIAIMQLVGARDGKIRRPFMVASLLQGAVGGALAAGATLWFKTALLDGQLGGSLAVTAVTWEQAVQIALTVGAVGVLTTGLVAYVSVRRYLRGA